jgi:circadian clock protein KaiC
MERGTVRDKLPTGIAGLDLILHGGLVARVSHLIVGPTGSGKTVLANQIACNVARAGKRVVYVSLLVESNGDIITNLRSMDFFDERFVGKALYYVDAERTIASGGRTALLSMIEAVVRQQQPAVVVLDSLNSVKSWIGGPELRGLVLEVSALLAIHRCTLLMTGHTEADGVEDLYTVADVLIELLRVPLDARLVREMQILKSRGTGTMEGRHSFTISSRGVVVHPRTEMRLHARPPATTTPAAAPTVSRRRLGIERLDAMLGGGLWSDSTTLLVGPSGSGKSLIGAQFLCEGAAVGESGLYIGFYEWPHRLIASAARIGLRLEEWLARGVIEVAWRPRFEQLIDALADDLLAAVERRGVQRLVIDGLDGVTVTVTTRERLLPFWVALTDELRRLGVTTIVTDTPELFAFGAAASVAGFATLADNIIYMSALPLEQRLEPLVTVLKVRGATCERDARRLSISARGIEVGEVVARPPV